jgi:hypothetical protein
MAFLSWDRFAAAMENGHALADELGADGLTVNGQRASGGLFESLGPDPLRRSMADLVVAPGREEAASASGQVSGGVETARPYSQDNVAWDWVGDLLAEPGVTPPAYAPARLGETEGQALPHGDGGTPAAFAEHATQAEERLSSPAPYANAAHAAYSSSAFDATPFYGSGQVEQVQPSSSGNVSSQPPQLANGQSDSRPAAAKTSQEVAQTYGKLPLRFEANVGQSDARVQFLSRGPGYSVFLTNTEAVLALSPQQKASGPSELLHLQLVGSNPRAQAAGLDLMETRSNYFIGSDPAQWHSNVPNYGRVVYQGVYPGIDLVYHGSSQQQLEYDFDVAPGADPALFT